MRAEAAMDSTNFWPGDTERINLPCDVRVHSVCHPEPRRRWGISQSCMIVKAAVM